MKIIGTPNNWFIGFSIYYFPYLESIFSFDINARHLCFDFGKVSFSFHWWKNKKA